MRGTVERVEVFPFSFFFFSFSRCSRRETRGRLTAHGEKLRGRGGWKRRRLRRNGQQASVSMATQCSPTATNFPALAELKEAGWGCVADVAM